MKNVNIIKVSLLILIAVALLNSCSNPNIDSSSTSDTISKDQGQFWSSNIYLVTDDDGGEEGESQAATLNTAFGVNHATGHIKGYPSDETGNMAKHVRAVVGIDSDFVYGTTYTYTDNSSDSSLYSENMSATVEDSYVKDTIDGDVVVVDKSTGLMWMADDAGYLMDWKDALSYANSTTYASYSDWRLPDVKELQSIVDYSGVYPAIALDYFNYSENTSNTNYEEDSVENPNYYYWTSTSAYLKPDTPTYAYAWYVAFGYAVGDDGEDSHGAGAVRFSPKYSASSAEGEGGDNSTNSVRLVRTPNSDSDKDEYISYYQEADSRIVTTNQSDSYDEDGNVVTPSVSDEYYGQDAVYSYSSEFYFTDNGDGTITDNRTGLIWEQTPSDEHLSFSEAEEYCESLELGDRTDWRLPTAEELFSISDFSEGWPYLDESYFDFPSADIGGGDGNPQG